MTKEHKSVVSQTNNGGFTAKCKDCGFQSEEKTGYGSAQKSANGHATKQGWRK